MYLTPELIKEVGRELNELTLHLIGRFGAKHICPVSINFAGNLSCVILVEGSKDWSVLNANCPDELEMMVDRMLGMDAIIRKKRSEAQKLLKEVAILEVSAAE